MTTTMLLCSQPIRTSAMDKPVHRTTTVPQVGFAPPASYVNTARRTLPVKENISVSMVNFILVLLFRLTGHNIEWGGGVL